MERPLIVPLEKRLGKAKSSDVAQSLPNALFCVWLIYHCNFGNAFS